MQLIVLLNHDFNYSNNLYCLQLSDLLLQHRFVVAKFVALSASQTRRSADQGNIRLSLQLIISISRILKTSLNCFYGTAVFTSAIPVLLLFLRLFVSLNLSLNGSESSMLLLTESL